MGCWVAGLIWGAWSTELCALTSGIHSFCSTPVVREVARGMAEAVGEASAAVEAVAVELGHSVAVAG